MQTKFSFKILPLFLGGVFLNSAYADQSIFSQNIDVSKNESEFLKSKEEQKLARSLFLPELSINGGLGSEKLNDKTDKEEGPYLFLEGKINLFKGGRDQTQVEKINLETKKRLLETEISGRKLKIESFKLITETNRLKAENDLLLKEIKDNQIQRNMALKKVNAGLTTNVDILDFDIKEQNLNNRVAINNLNIETNIKNLLALYAGKSTLSEIESNFDNTDEKKIEGYNSADWINISAAKLDYEISSLDKKIVRSEYSPVIDLEAKWGQITPQQEVLKNEKEHQVLLNINIPLYTGGTTSYKTQQAILESSQKERELRQIEIEAKTNFDVEQKKIETLQTLLKSYQQILSKAENYKSLTVSEYKRGIKNSPDVISASDKLLEVAIKTLETKTELSVATFSFSENFKH